MEALTDAQHRAVLSEFLSRTEHGKGLLPLPQPFPYDPVPGMGAARWSVFITEEMIEGELRELTNKLNHWMGNLRRWHAWNEVLTKHDDETRWGIEWEWVEPIAFHCMFQPSATRDCFIMVATNALHQVRMAIDPTIKDELLGDPTKPEESRFFPRRRDKEQQLKAMARAWTAGKGFIQALGQLDDRGHRRVTFNFRNRASHGIAPRFSVGDIAIVTRERVQATTMEEQPDRSFEVVTVPNKMATGYSFGGTLPLTMVHAWETNRAQFERARCTFDAYVALLAEASAAMPKKRPPAMKDCEPREQKAEV
jgi:hypothetical protein